MNFTSNSIKGPFSIIEKIDKIGNAGWRFTIRRCSFLSFYEDNSTEKGACRLVCEIK